MWTLPTNFEALAFILFIMKNKIYMYIYVCLNTSYQQPFIGRLFHIMIHIHFNCTNVKTRILDTLDVSSLILITPDVIIS